MSIRIVLADDHIVFRQGLSALLHYDPDVEVVGQADDGHDAIRLTRQLQPDVVLMDIIMPCMEGIEAAERIMRQHPEARIVMVSSVGYQENIITALQKGARHFVQKPVKAELLYDVIKYVMGSDAVASAPAGANV